MLGSIKAVRVEVGVSLIDLQWRNVWLHWFHVFRVRIRVPDMVSFELVQQDTGSLTTDYERENSMNILSGK
jgi:hypothetical protein